MAIYSIDNYTDFEYDDSVNESKYDIDMDGAYELMVENEINYNRIMEAVYNAERAVYEAEGKEMDYSEQDTESFKNKMVAFFKSIGDKLKEFFSNLWTKIKTVFVNAKAFVKKHEAELSAAGGSVQIKGFTFTEMDWDAASAFSKAQSYVDKEFNSNNADEFNARTITAYMLGKSRGDVYDQDLGTAVTRFFRNGKDEADTVTVSVKDALSSLSKDKETAKTVKKGEDSAQKCVKDAIDEVNKAAKEAKKDKEKIKELHAKAAAYKLIINCGHRIIAAQVKAHMDRFRQSKEVCVRALAALNKSKKAVAEAKPQAESALDSFLDGIELL